MSSSSKERWRYERGEGRHKHCWAKPVAGFEPSGKGAIGKCPNDIDEALAEEILNRGVPLYEAEEDDYPARIYAVHRGVIYEAVPTRPGVSYHGYPWRGDIPGRPALPRGVLKKLEDLALAANEEREFKKWLRKYG